MAEISPATPSDEKPVIVRVKRKASQTALDAFWLEINERRIKRPLIDFEKLSISDAFSSKVEELKTKKILVRHVETFTSSKDTFDVLRSFVPNSSAELKSKEKIEERRRSFKNVNRQDQLVVKARQRQEVLSRCTRFEQIWRSRKGKEETPEDETVYDMCRLYDVVRVDVEERIIEVPNQKDAEKDDYKMMADFLPLLREVLPVAAEEIEHDIDDVMSKQDGYVYDVYAVEDDAIEMEEVSTSLFPLVQVNDDDDDTFYDGPDDSEYESDDSNAENNPLHDYPDEEASEEEEEASKEASEEEEEVSSSSSDEKSEGECESESDEQMCLSEGSELYVWSDYGEEDWDGDEEPYL